MLEIDLKPAIKELKEIGAKKILVQIPEGLKVKTEDIIDELEAEGIEVISEMTPCFGACDIKVSEALLLKCDAVLHIGHSEFMKIKDIPVVYLPLYYKLDNFEEISTKLLDYLKEKEIKEIGLITTAQFLPYISDIRVKLESEGIKVLTKDGPRVKEGQALGCNYSAVPDTEHIVYFGDGYFHPLGIHFSAQREVILANPFKDSISTLDKEKDKFLRQRILLIEKAKEAKSFAILVSSKVGQQRLHWAESVQAELKMKGYEANIYTMDHVSEDKLLGIKAGAYINTACPRLSIDDFFNWKKPMINSTEVKYLLGKESYDNYKLDLAY
jgi:2-(3-amino-3-carboxypropyl)histidine synthase